MAKKFSATTSFSLFGKRKLFSASSPSSSKRAAKNKEVIDVSSSPPSPVADSSVPASDQHAIVVREREVTPEVSPGDDQSTTCSGGGLAQLPHRVFSPLMKLGKAIPADSWKSMAEDPLALIGQELFEGAIKAYVSILKVAERQTKADAEALKKLKAEYDLLLEEKNQAEESVKGFCAELQTVEKQAESLQAQLDRDVPKARLEAVEEFKNSLAFAKAKEEAVTAFKNSLEFKVLAPAAIEKFKTSPAMKDIRDEFFTGGVIKTAFTLKRRNPDLDVSEYLSGADIAALIAKEEEEAASSGDEEEGEDEEEAAN